MALSEHDLAQLDAVLASRDAAAGVVAELRLLLPGLKITQCDPADIDLETPFRTWPHFALHLIDGAAHCWRLTNDADAATGLVIVPLQASE